MCVRSVIDDDGVWMVGKAGRAKGVQDIGSVSEQQQEREEGLKVGCEVLVSTQ